MTILALIRSENYKLLTSRASWIITLITILGTWPMTWMNAAAGADISLDDPRLFSSEPIPLEYQGFEMAGFGYVLVLALAALWAGSEYGSAGQIRTTLLATPQRLRVFLVKASRLASIIAIIAFVTMAGTIMITHSTAGSEVASWALTPAIWANIGGVTLTWTLMALVVFSIGTLARTAILPLILITPLVIGIGDFLSSIWDGAKYLPTTAGAALYSDPAAGNYLSPAMGGFIQSVWALALLAIAAVVFVRRDL